MDQNDGKKSFKWKCLENDIKTKEFVENELPGDFEYIVNRFKMCVDSDIPHESKFEAGFVVNVCSADGVNKFVQELELRTGTNFNPVGNAKRTGKKNWTQQLLKCARNVRTQTSPGRGKARGKGDAAH